MGCFGWVSQWVVRCSDLVWSGSQDVLGESWSGSRDALGVGLGVGRGMLWEGLGVGHEVL